MRRLWIWGPVVAQMASIFVASSMSAVPSLPAGLSDYTGHFIGYALLGALALRGFAGATWRGVTNQAAGRAVFMSSLYGVSDEFHQAFVPGRTPSVTDWAADTLGALAGAALVMAVSRLVARHRANRGV